MKTKKIKRSAIDFGVDYAHCKRELKMGHNIVKRQIAITTEEGLNAANLLISAGWRVIQTTSKKVTLYTIA